MSAVTTPPSTATAPAFCVIGGDTVAAVLAGRHRTVRDLVDRTYRAHGEGRTVNPHSHFLRFPDRPEARIIALPASVSGERAVNGIKWISSYPRNTEAGLARASAVLVLNDPDTGHPYACLESSLISAARTAASAALAAERLSEVRPGRARPRTVSFVGTGLIARHIHTYLVETGWSFDRTTVFDADPAHAETFRASLAGRPASGELAVAADAETAIRAGELVVLATTAARPHVQDPRCLEHAPLVLHVSLRDLAPALITGAANVLDDVDHCLRAETSVHLAEQATGRRDFVTGTLPDYLAGRRTLPSDRPVVFSPFGLGVLDLSLGRYVFEQAVASGRVSPVRGFFPSPDASG
ncbi:2,3-diaminopropionate biosynthesis protein SbnB [Streptomyces griseoflavus]|uniref:2,3-diaminopropionate biosynthesis protein SbnB n=1 Tax=Streptomyces griseoflavus TaxID=35619 RepID=UPI00167ED7D4|nr:2,3-diaminopropionate biosynthesis protein SbnB [Streptomyces griseoflavus]GGV46643.1 2,3-diaminopropionate biosynthesis protein SbnB [Streptomyces griseoflavus]